MANISKILCERKYQELYCEVNQIIKMLGGVDKEDGERGIELRAENSELRANKTSGFRS